MADASLMQQKSDEMEQENALLKQDAGSANTAAVNVPEEMKPLFNKAHETVNEYFRHLKMEPTKGTIEINDQRYLLIRASALSKDFLDTIQNLYADRGEHEAMAIGKNFLFDIAHVIGMNDAKNFHAKMNLQDPLSKLSAGPIHFAYTGWAYVDIKPESHPTPDENFYLIYDHPYSFEADSWQRSGKRSVTPVCIMNAGYSSGWCEESFGIPLTAVEVSCKAKGDDHCTFIMSPPHKIQEHLDKFNISLGHRYIHETAYSIPTFFERKKVEEEMQRSKILAEESAKSKADFLANMSHELRTPLGTILGFSDLLRKTNLDSTQKEYLDAISTSGKTLLSIINNVLDLSKLDAGKFIVEHVSFNVSDLMHSVQVMFDKKAKNKDLKLTLLVDSAINYNVYGDPMRLTQILMNLIGNAIKFTHHGKTEVCCVTGKEDDDDTELCFTITDTGIGIPADKIDHVFERFTQADSNTTRKYGGTGLGLSITKQLIELLGGTITVTSEEGKGTVFTFCLPFKKSKEEIYRTSYNDAVPVLQYNSVKRILIVEDTVLNQKLTSVILQNNGFESMIAENGKQATEILQKEKFDLILMDIQMPEMDGYEATCIIREKMNIKTRQTYR
jgi:signal transduction histidine kinase/predicted hydrocarbon binding protein